MRLDAAISALMVLIDFMTEVTFHQMRLTSLTAIKTFENYPIAFDFQGFIIMSADLAEKFRKRRIFMPVIYES